MTLRFKVSCEPTVSAVFSSSPCDAAAAPADRVVLGSVSTQHRLAAVGSVAAGRTSCSPGEKAHVQTSCRCSSLLYPLPPPTGVAVRSDEARWTFAGPASRVALPAVGTPTLAFTVGTVAALRTHWRRSCGSTGGSGRR